MQLQKYGYSVICSPSSYHNLSSILTPSHPPHVPPSLITPPFSTITLLHSIDSSHLPSLIRTSSHHSLTPPSYHPSCTIPSFHHAPLPSPSHHPSHLPPIIPSSHLPFITPSHAPPSHHPLTAPFIHYHHLTPFHHHFQVFRVPHFTECCGQNYCGSCIGRWLLSHPTCPNCWAPNSHTSRTRNWSGRFKS